MVSKKMHASEFSLLAEAADNIQNDFIVKRNQWAGSRFEWASKLPSGSKGKLGKRLINAWCALHGLAPTPSPDSQADILLNGHRVEIKFSMLWKGGIYKFQQIRDQDYEILVCLGISPSQAHCWVITKKLLKTHVIGHTGQHTGKSGKDTAWLSFRPDSPPIWLVKSGGSMADAIKLLKAIKQKR